MSVKEVTYYEIRCDGNECTFGTSDIGSDYSAWSDASGAEADWDSSDMQTTPEGKHYCDKHRVPMCADCDKTEGLTNDEPDNLGDWWCTEHAPKAADTTPIGAPQ